MRRPWELAHMQASPAPACPRVYVPFTLPDTNASTFAVLELVGFSSSPSSSQSSFSPSLAPSLTASQICHSQLQYPISFSLPTSQCCDAPNSAEIPIETSITSLTQSSTMGVHLASAPNPHSIKSAHGAGVAPSSLPPAVATKPAVVPIYIKENVVHTTSLNFKDIVQQLTGASSNIDKPSISRTVKLSSTATTPTPPAKRTLDALSVKVGSSKGFKISPSKLQQRRKSQCKLERLCTENGLALPISPLSPSPVTPLASYFKNSCAAITPTASQSSGHSSGISSPEASLLESNSSNTSIIVRSYPANVAAPCPSGTEGAAHALSRLQQDAPIKETLHGPAILSLFPESPL